MADVMDAQELVEKVTNRTATVAEMRKGMDLLEAIEAAEQGNANAGHVTILKAFGLLDDEAGEGTAEEGGEGEGEGSEGAEGGDAWDAIDPNGEPIVYADPEEPEAETVEKGGLPWPGDPPGSGAWQQEIAQAGPEAQGAVDVSPVLQAGIAVYERVAKALEDHTVALLAQNELLALVAAQTEGVPALAKSLKASFGQIQKSLADLGSQDGQAVVLKAIESSVQNGLGNRLGEALNRVGNIEQVLNNRSWTGNPPRNGAAMGKALIQGGVGGDIGYAAAMSAIQKSALADFEKADALAKLDIAQDNEQSFLGVLDTYGLMPNGQAQPGA